MKGLLAKISLSFILITTAYYFLFLQPQHQLYQAKQALSTHRTNLIQNRLAITQLINLKPTNPYFTQEQSLLLKQLQTTNQQGLENLTNQETILNLPKNIDQTVTQLQTKHQTLLQNQQQLITRLQQTNNLQVIFTSPQAITLLTRQTNLILEYDHLLNQFNQSLATLQL
jgi:hypothetical protein